MSDRIISDAYNIKKLLREAEALADESMLAFAKLKQAMLVARLNPAIEVHTGQRALMRLNQAEQEALSMSSNLLRVHQEMSDLAKVYAGTDENIPTETQPSAVIDEPARVADPA